MKLYGRLSIPLIALLGVALPLTFVLVLCWPLPGTEGAGLSDTARSFLREMRRGDELEQRDHEILDCTQRKIEITDDLVAARMTLLQAIQEFDQLNRQLEQTNPAPASYPLPGTEEEECECVFRWVRANMENKSERTAVLARLEEERQRLFSGRGTGRTGPSGPVY